MIDPREKTWILTMAAVAALSMTLGAAEAQTTTTSTTTTTLLAPGCADPNGDDTVNATDALLTLKTAVSLITCDQVRCDVNDDDSVNATDALLVLKKAVQLPVSLDCPGVNVSTVDSLPGATDPVADSGSSVSSSLLARASQRREADSSSSDECADNTDESSCAAACCSWDATSSACATPTAISMGTGADYFDCLAEDSHADPSIGACEMVNRLRNAVSWASEGDMIMCYIKEIVANQSPHVCSTTASTSCSADTDCPTGETCEPAIDVYDGQSHIIDMEMSHPGFCAAAETLTQCRSDSDCGTSGPCMSFDAEGEGTENIRIKVTMAREGTETDGTITDFEMFACEFSDATEFQIDVELDDTTNFGALQVDVDYSEVSGFFEGEGADVECTSALSDSGVLFVANDDDEEQILRLGYVSLFGTDGPVTVATCNFTATASSVSASDFETTVSSAADTSGEELRLTASIADLATASGEMSQMHYLHQGLNGVEFVMDSKGVFADSYGAGGQSVAVSAELNDSGEFTGSKTIAIASQFSDASASGGTGFTGFSEETFIQDADTVTMSGVEQGKFSASDEDNDGQADGGSDEHDNRMIGIANLVDGNAEALAAALAAGTIASADEYDYDVDLLSVGVGAGKAAMKGSFSFVPCTEDTCGFEETCDRLELEENSDGECVEEWNFAVVEGWNATGAVDDETAVDYVTQVVDAELPSPTGNDVEFAAGESWDCSGTAEASIEVDMFAVILACGDMIDHDDHFSCHDAIGDDGFEECDWVAARCSISDDECVEDADCTALCSETGNDCTADADCLTGETCQSQTCDATEQCDFEDPCEGPDPESYCFDDEDEMEAFDPCAVTAFCKFTGEDCESDAECASVCAMSKESCDSDSDCMGNDSCVAQACEQPQLPPFCTASSTSTAGNCCEVRFGDPGCEDEEIQALVCSDDDYCCNFEWDGPCVWLANDLGAECFDSSIDPCAGSDKPFWCQEGFGDDDPCLSDNPPAFCFKTGDPCTDPAVDPKPTFCEDSDDDGVVDFNPCDPSNPNPPASCMGDLNPCMGDWPPPWCFDTTGGTVDPCMSANPPDFCFEFVSPCASADPPEWCATEQGDCCSPTFGVAGCDSGSEEAPSGQTFEVCGDDAICNNVCAMDGYCCDVEWDPPCVQGADAAGAGCYAWDADATGNNFDPCQGANPPPFCFAIDGTGECCAPHPSPGCDDETVETTVCAMDPFCCNDHWDPWCVQEADQAGAGCFDAFSEDVCAGDNPPPFCFGDAEDFDPCDLPPEEQPFFCGTATTDSPFGNCCLVRFGEPECQDETVTQCVCNIDDYCCNVEWDGPCVAVADKECSGECFDEANDPCAGQDPPFWCQDPDDWEQSKDPCFCPPEDVDPEGHEQCEASLPPYCGSGFDDPCSGDNPASWCDPCETQYPPPYCFDDPGAFDPCDSEYPPPFCSGEGEAANNCCQPRPETGCEEAGVETCVCDQDAFCCGIDADGDGTNESGEWDGPCVTLANGCMDQLGLGACFDQSMDPCAGPMPPFWCNAVDNENLEEGDCCVVTLGIAGCSDDAVVKCVCDDDPYCCNVEWDGACVQGAKYCEVECELGADPCAGDFPPPFCFGDDYDEYDPCNDPNNPTPPDWCMGGAEGDCCVPNPAQGCSALPPEVEAEGVMTAAQVETCVCTDDPWCCGQEPGELGQGEWDGICVGIADSCLKNAGGSGCFAGGSDPCAPDASGNVPFWCEDPDEWETENNDPCYCHPDDLDCEPEPWCDKWEDDSSTNTDSGDGSGEQGNCCQPTPGVTGCTDSSAQECVCDMDPYCCNTEWDSFCVGEAGLCQASCFSEGGHDNPCAGDDPAPWCFDCDPTVPGDCNDTWNDCDPNIPGDCDSSNGDGGFDCDPSIPGDCDSSNGDGGFDCDPNIPGDCDSSNGDGGGGPQF